MLRTRKESTSKGNPYTVRDDKKSWSRFSISEIVNKTKRLNASYLGFVTLLLLSLYVLMMIGSLTVSQPEGVRRVLRIDKVPPEKRRENHVDYIQVYEDFLPPESLHQEGGACRVGTLLFMVGGINSVGEYVLDAVNNAHLGGSVVTIYDMKDMSVTHGPKLPFRANHMNCAENSEGVLHVTGGYRQDAPKGEPLAYNHLYTLDTKLPRPEWKWVKKADMPQGLGGHGCAFLANNKLYCVGGGIAQMGPYQKDMVIYDPGTNSWTHGPPMRQPRDHCMGSAIAINGGKQLYIVGGKSMISAPEEKTHYLYWTPAHNAELFDLESNTWTLLRNLLVDRSSIDLVPYARQGPGYEPNLLLVGGQETAVYSGYGFNLVEEYDIEKDIYYCHTPLPFPYYSGGIGMYKGKLHVVGGAEWFGVSARRRVMVYDFNKAPPPKPCFYKPVPQFDQWDRFGAMPYPGINDVISPRASEIKQYRNDHIEYSTSGGAVSKN